MFKRYTRTSVSILFVALVAGCVVPQPTVTPVSSTVTTVPPALTAVSLTLTPVPPASLPSEAATSIPVETAPLDGRGGGFIAFYSERDGNAEIYIINADGSAETRLTQDRARDIVPDLSPDGSQIVFVSNRNGNDEIYRMDRDGSDVVRLTDTRAEDTYPYWSSDGTKIIFCSRRDDDRTYEVYLMNSDGTDQTRITNNAVSEEWAYLSLDMQEVVYAVGPFPHYSLYVMNIDGSDSRQIFSSDRSAALPKWSRDGRTIVFNHFTLSSGKIIGDIGWVNRDGNNFRQITRSSDDSVSENPYWSPDGSRIVFQLNQTGNFQIYVMDADGSNQVRLTNHRGNDYWPSWGGTHSPVLPFQMEKGEQGFSSRETFQAGLGDLDGDGDLDAVFANPQKNNAQVWLNDGKGMFVDTGQQLTQYGHGVGVADFDGDGDLDAFIACHQFVTASRIYLNDGAGLFQDSGQDLGDASISGAELNLVDLNGDGNVDVHVMYYDPNGLPDRVYLNDGAGVFSDSGLALDEETIAWGDLDSDGDVDYFGKRWGQGYVAQFNDGGQFSTGWEMEDSQSTVGGVALADFDGDGDLDALVTNGFRRTGSFLSLLFWNDGGGQFTDSGQRLNETMGSELAVGDLDGDGDLDVFVSNMDLPNEVWLNERGQFIDSGLRLGENSDMSGKPSLGDLDGDGDLDVFVGRFNGGAEVWFNNTSSVESRNGSYLGQTPPGLDVEIFAPGIVSIEDGKEYKIAFSPDLEEIFFTRRTPGGRDDRLWYSRVDNGTLTMPEPAPFAYDSLESDACFTPDGNRLYFNSWRPLPGEETPSAHHNVWFVDKTEGGWSEPQFLGPPLNDYRPVYFSIADDGTLYFTRSSPREIGYAELQDGQYAEVQRLPDEINYLRDVAHPAVAPDESYIIVDSCYEQAGRLTGSLYISFRRPDGSWTRAVSMRDALKASESDVYAAPRVTPDGKYLFFEKYLPTTDQADIYWVSAEIIETLRRDPNSTANYAE